jgi:hypothetical protein
MTRACVAALITASMFVGAPTMRGSISAQQAACLHGQDEAAAQRDRRVQALRLTRQINTLENAMLGQALQYQPLNAVPNVGAPPQGFAVHFATDGSSYAFSVKDTLDPCAFAYFSDETGVIYTGQALQ